MLENFKTKLDYGKAILFCDDDINLDAFRTEIKPRLMILKSEPDKIYGLDYYDFTGIYKEELFETAEKIGLKPINITAVLREKVRNIVDKELQKYIENNMNNIDYITEYSLRDYPSYNTKTFEFLSDARYFGVDIRNDNEVVKEYNISLRQVNNGKIGFYKDEYSSSSFEYDLEKQEFNIPDEEILKRVYCDKKLKLILAYQQYIKGITPPIYNEIARINEFLENKKSVTFELHNGTKVKAETHLSNILDIKDTGEIYIADRYTNKIIEGESIDYCQCLATELKCLKYSKNELTINSNALKSLELEEIKEDQIEDEEEEM